MKFILLGWTSLALTVIASFSRIIHADPIKFINHCPYDIWFWTVGPKDSNIDGSDASRTKVTANQGSVVHGMFTDNSLSAGVTLKIRDLPYYQVPPAGIVQVEYNVEADQKIWYDLSVIDCNPSLGPEDPSYCPLIAGGIKLHIPGADDKDCPPAWCSRGSCQNTYKQPRPLPMEPSWDCKSGVEMVIETCTEGIGPRTFQDQPLPVLSFI